MKKILALIRKEFLQRVRGKGFLIGTLLMPVLFIGISFLPGFFMSMGGAKTERVAIVDLTRRLQPSLVKMSEGEGYDFDFVDADSASLESVRNRLASEVRSDHYDVLLVVPANALEGKRPTVQLYAKNISNFERKRELRSKISEAVGEIRLVDSGLDPDLVKRLTGGVSLKTFKVGKSGAEERSGGVEFGLVYLLVFSLYMTLIFYGSFVMRGVIEEKSSRAVETILSMVRPGQLMAGKILGIGAVGLLQYLIWVILIVLFFLFGVGWLQGRLGPDVPIPSVPLGILAAFVVFFVLGYFLYSTLWAALGSVVNSESEAQQLQFPLIMLLIVPFMAMFYVINDPHSTASIVLSLIPFFTPILMFVRIAVDPPSLVQILASVFILVATVWVSIWAVGRIFRVGILMIGKRPTLPEVMHWLRYG